ncbi:hypothetical protein [Novosphingobium beihaiensis]|uniref:Uncharacterized protein n=1 Tax=Novosphingobium beihaiensis TaxID=2930389 RepID=A0ABT0BTT7_9SPHN|nr:hypothetical protein [Novosphingobium beihaiensis]MCJ2188479.1 hypothetical protein [Novosphingobium beihaiensis]
MASTTEDFVVALKKIRGDADLSHKFMQDPHGTLSSLGVKVGKNATLASGAASAAAVCVGACVCVG